jgi:para-aminobenzoate synthetase component 1
MHDPRHDARRACFYHLVMREAPTVTSLPQLRALSPLDVISRWPCDRRLTMLHSGREHKRWARWSILAEPCATWRFDGRSRWIGPTPPDARGLHFSDDPLADLDAVLRATQTPTASPLSALPFAGGWIGHFGYELGGVIEPCAQSAQTSYDDSPWPLIELAWCPAAMVFDHTASQWHAVGDVRGILRELGPVPIESEPSQAQYTVSSFTPAIDESLYCSMVARAIEYIRAGDIFQANIAQRFTATFAGSMRSIAVDSISRNKPWYGAYLEMADDAPSTRSIVSLSPELFLQIDPLTREVTTRPIKGTRASTASVRELLRSEKDAAELHMIVDLMRNDLGRVCEFGSVQVPHARTIETHPTVHHGVGEVTGTLRGDVSAGHLLRATFPGGSITGAPKIRAMQIINELEQERRGPYCGAIGFISDCGRMSLNIAIRTMLLHGKPETGAVAGRLVGSIDYWAGAGIVADSDPRAEYRECLQKAAVLGSLASPHVSLERRHPMPIGA